MRRSGFWTAICAAGWVAIAAGNGVAQENQPPDKTLSPYFSVEGGDPAVDRLPLKDTRVEFVISGVIADVVVRQVYENQGLRPLHARYVFPASTRAAVYGMTMTVGNMRIVAKIQERAKAKAEFETAKRDGKSASLLEQSRPNVFTMNVANVLPGDTISVELKYTELLTPSDGVYEFVYPTVVGPRYSEKREGQAAPGDEFVKAGYTHEGEPPRSQLHLNGVVAAGMPIQELYSPSHQLVSRVGADGRAEIALDESETNPGNRDVILRYRLSGQKIASGLLLYQSGGENYFLLMAQPPQAVVAADLPPREYIFVIDVSGSMNGFPLETAKKLLANLASGLRPFDAFNIVVFADGSQTFSRESVPATSANLSQALRFIGPKRGGGGTRLLAALETAVAIPRQPAVSRSVVLLTDGYVDTEGEIFEYVRNQLHETNFFAFGIGSSVNRHLIEGIAHAGQGEPFVVTGPDEAPEAAGQFRHYIDSPVLTGIDVRFAGFDAYDVEPRKVPDLFASRPIVIFGKYRGAAAGTIEISGKTGREQYRSSIAVTPANADARQSALRYLWARTRIANLNDASGGLPPDTVAEITSLGLTYNLLTPYTSFIAVQEIVRRAGDADDVDQPLPLPAGVTDQAVGVASGPEPELGWVLALAVSLVAGAKLLRRTTRRGAGSLS